MTAAPIVRMLSVLVLSLAAGSSGCDPSDQCDSGYYVEHGACYPNPVPIPDAGGSDAQLGEDEDGGGSVPDAEPPSDPYEGFGDACEDVSDCRDGLICGAPQLALCTQVNCLEDPTVCPPGWTCYDTMGASPDPTVTSVCLMF
jgi:hypothetical protein